MLYICKNYRKRAVCNMLDYASAAHRDVSVCWVRRGGVITLTVECPDTLASTVALPEAYTFESGESELPLRTGTYTIIRK